MFTNPLTWILGALFLAYLAILLMPDSYGSAHPSDDRWEI